MTLMIFTSKSGKYNASYNSISWEVPFSSTHLICARPIPSGLLAPITVPTSAPNRHDLISLINRSLSYRTYTLVLLSMILVQFDAAAFKADWYEAYLVVVNAKLCAMKSDHCGLGCANSRT